MYKLNIQRFGGRGQKYVPNNVLNKAFGKKGKPMESLEAARGANPHYMDGEEYRINCQKTVYAYELRRRGYNVEALPTYRGQFDPMYQGGGWYNAFENQTWDKDLGKRNTQVQKTIESKMQNWGEGSRAVIYVAWSKRKSAHVFNVEQKNGQVYAYDPQKGGMVDLAHYLSMSRPSRTMISRVDNLSKPREVLQHAVKEK